MSDIYCTLRVKLTPVALEAGFLNVFPSNSPSRFCQMILFIAGSHDVRRLGILCSQVKSFLANSADHDFN